MKRTLAVVLILCLLSALGCSGNSEAYRHERFELVLPEGWERADEAGVVCFAKNGDPVRSSSIIFYATDKNYYFDTFDGSDYSGYVNQLAEYELISLVDFSETTLDGWNAHRIVYSASIDMSPINIIMYAVDADMSYFFILFEMEGDNLAEKFDSAMEDVKIITG
ncbi:MAG: hypothetical protein Q4C01_03895 [Clostridia bacterium]|nr:hypothetical protein [Clostridia bacterium]